MIRSRRLWFSIGVALALLVVVALVATSAFAPTVIAQLESQLSRTLNTRVTLGKLRIILPWQVTVGPVVINSPSGPPLVDAPEVALSFNLLSLLTGGGPQAHLNLQRPTFYLRRDREGRLNLPVIENTAGGSTGGINRLVSGLDVSNAIFTYDDRVLAGRALRIEGVAAQASLDAARAHYTLWAPVGAGEAQAAGETTLDSLATQIDARLRNLSAPLLATVLNLGSLSVQRGTVEGALRLQLDQAKRLSITGPLRVVGGQLALAGVRAPATNLDITSELTFPRLAVQRIDGRLAGASVRGTGLLTLPGQLDLNLNVAGTLEKLSTALINPPVKLQGGVVAVLQAAIPSAKPDNLVATGTVQQTTALTVDKLRVDRLDARLRYERRQLTVPFTALLAGGAVSGRATLAEAGRQVAVQATGSGLDIEALAARYGTNLPTGARAGTLDFVAQVTGPPTALKTTVDFVQQGGAFAGRPLATTGTATLTAQTLVLDRANVQIARTGQIELTGQTGLGGRRPLLLFATLRDVPLNLASPSLGGTVRGQATVRGELAGIPESLQVEGTAQVDRPVLAGRTLPAIDAAFRYRDEILTLDRFASDGLLVRGTLVPDLKAPPERLLARADLDIVLDRLDLARLPLGLDVAGRLSGQGRFRGNLQSPDLQLALRLRDAQVGRYQIAALDGPLSWQGRDIRTSLAGGSQRLTAQARLQDRGVELVALNVRVAQATVVADNGFYDYRRGLTRLKARIADLVLDDLGIGPLGPVRSLGGRADAQVVLSQDARGQLQGSIDAHLANGKINSLDLGDVRTRLQLSNNQIAIAPTALTIDDARYSLAGRAGLGANAPIDIDLQAESGRLEHLVRLLDLYSLSGLIATRDRSARGRAADLGVIDIGKDPPTPLRAILAVYDVAATSTIERLSTESRSPIPDNFRQLRGSFDFVGHIGGSRAAPNARFDLTGRDWNWRPWQLEQVRAAGTYQDQVLQLSEATARYRERCASLEGRLALAGPLQARLSVRKFPLELAEAALPAGTRLSGDLDTDAEVGGSLQDPVATARLSVQKLAVNGRSIDPIKTQLAVRDGRAVLDTTAVGVGGEGAQISGSAPIPPLNPANNDLDLSVNFDGKNLPLLNIVSDQLVFQPAQGQVAIKVAGTLDEPVIDGVVDLRATSIEIRQLKSKLVVDRLAARFDRERLLLDQLTGNLAGAPIAGSGSIPLRPGNDQSALVLTATGTIDLPRLYRGGIDAKITVGRAIVRPLIGGAVVINPGQLLFTLQDIVALAGGGDSGLVAGPASQNNLPVAFRDLQVQIGPQFRIALSNLDARLDGKLSINGPLRRLRATGAIEVAQGSLAIGPARFRLDSTRSNTLTFNNSLDPVLDLRAEASVSDFQQTGLASLDSQQLRFPTLANSQTALGTVDRVDVRAEITGPASEPQIDLTSSPPRSKEELLALIGGFNGGSGSLVSSAAQLLGGSLLNPISQDLASAFGLDALNFDLGGTAVAGPQSSSVGLSVEAVKDLGPAISISARRSVSDNLQPTIYGVRYRLSDQVVIRATTTTGATNGLQDSQSLSVEYESRF